MMSIACAYMSVTTISGFLAPTTPYCPGDLIFEDNFDTLNMRTWKHELTLGGGSSNNQFQLYNNNRSNTYVRDGILHLAPTLLADEMGASFLTTGTLDINGWYPHAFCTNGQYNGCKRTGTTASILNPIKSSRLSTATSFAVTYCKIEVRAKAPLGDWLWPAIWMVPRDVAYSTWPASGEIDIMEFRSNRNYTQNNIQIGSQQLLSTLHWGPNPNYNKYRLTTFAKQNSAGWNADFHRYQLLWTSDNITMSIDDIVMGTVIPPDGGFWEMGGFNNSGLNNPWQGATKMAPFDQDFFFIINLAVGGTSYFPENAINQTPKPWKNSDGTSAVTNFWNGRSNWLPTWNLNSDTSHLQVDYIRVWAV